MSDREDRDALGASRAKLVALARRVHAADEAEDVVQDVLSRLLERGHEDLRSVEAWLMLSVRNAAIDARRRAVLHRRVLDLLASEPACEYGPVVELDDEVHAVLAALVATFGTCTAAALLLREAFDLPYEELAHGSGRTATAWRQQLHRASRRLRERGLERRRLDEDEAHAAALFREALATATPAKLHAFVRTTTVASAGASHPPVSPAHARAVPTLALVNGRYVLALVMDGHVLCALPVGVSGDASTEPLELLAS